MQIYTYKLAMQKVKANLLSPFAGKKITAKVLIFHQQSLSIIIPRGEGHNSWDLTDEIIIILCRNPRKHQEGQLELIVCNKYLVHCFLILGRCDAVSRITGNINSSWCMHRVPLFSTCARNTSLEEITTCAFITTIHCKEPSASRLISVHTHSLGSLDRPFVIKCGQEIRRIHGHTFPRSFGIFNRKTAPWQAHSRF